MSLDARPPLQRYLLFEEGLKLRPYRCTSGALTIGIGRNLDANGITLEEAYLLLEHDLATATHDLEHLWPWVVTVDEVRRAALIGMCFQMGATRLARFTVTAAALQAHDWERAATHVLASAWAHQTPDRARRVAEMLRTGEWPGVLAWS